MINHKFGRNLSKEKNTNCVCITNDISKWKDTKAKIKQQRNSADECGSGKKWYILSFSVDNQCDSLSFN